MKPEDQGRARGRGKPNRVKGVEGCGAAKGLEVHGVGRTTNDQGETEGTRESGGAIRTMLPVGAKLKPSGRWAEMEPENPRTKVKLEI